MYAYTIEISADDYENTNFNDYQVALEYFHKLKEQGLHPVFHDNIHNTKFE